VAPHPALLSLFGWCWRLNSGPDLARQVLCHLNLTSSPFKKLFFRIESCIFDGSWNLIAILLSKVPM
jgi:hypothetical protein